MRELRHTGRKQREFKQTHVCELSAGGYEHPSHVAASILKFMFFSFFFLLFLLKVTSVPLGILKKKKRGWGE